MNQVFPEVASQPLSQGMDASVDHTKVMQTRALTGSSSDEEEQLIIDLSDSEYEDTQSFTTVSDHGLVQEHEGSVRSRRDPFADDEVDSQKQQHSHARGGRESRLHDKNSFYNKRSDGSASYHPKTNRLDEHHTRHQTSRARADTRQDKDLHELPTTPPNVEGSAPAATIPRREHEEGGDHDEGWEPTPRGRPKKQGDDRFWLHDDRNRSSDKRSKSRNNQFTSGRSNDMHGKWVHDMFEEIDRDDSRRSFKSHKRDDRSTHSDNKWSTHTRKSMNPSFRKTPSNSSSFNRNKDEIESTRYQIRDLSVTLQKQPSRASSKSNSPLPTQSSSSAIGSSKPLEVVLIKSKSNESQKSNVSSRAKSPKVDAVLEKGSNNGWDFAREREVSSPAVSGAWDLGSEPQMSVSQDANNNVQSSGWGAVKKQPSKQANDDPQDKGSASKGIESKATEQASSAVVSSGCDVDPEPETVSESDGDPEPQEPQIEKSSIWSLSRKQRAKIETSYTVESASSGWDFDDGTSAPRPIVSDGWDVDPKPATVSDSTKRAPQISNAATSFSHAWGVKQTKPSKMSTQVKTTSHTSPLKIAVHKDNSPSSGGWDFEGETAQKEVPSSTSGWDLETELSQDPATPTQRQQSSLAVKSANWGSNKESRVTAPVSSHRDTSKEPTSKSGWSYQGNESQKPHDTSSRSKSSNASGWRPDGDSSETSAPVPPRRQISQRAKDQLLAQLDRRAPTQMTSTGSISPEATSARHGPSSSTSGDNGKETDENHEEQAGEASLSQYRGNRAQDVRVGSTDSSIITTIRQPSKSQPSSSKLSLDNRSLRTSQSARRGDATRQTSVSSVVNVSPFIPSSAGVSLAPLAEHQTSYPLQPMYTVPTGITSPTGAYMPMMTSTGQVIVMTEDGLAVPADYMYSPGSYYQPHGMDPSSAYGYYPQSLPYVYPQVLQNSLSATDSNYHHTKATQDRGKGGFRRAGSNSNQSGYRTSLHQVDPFYISPVTPAPQSIHTNYDVPPPNPETGLYVPLPDTSPTSLTRKFDLPEPNPTTSSHSVAKTPSNISLERKSKAIPIKPPTAATKRSSS